MPGSGEMLFRLLQYRSAQFWVTVLCGLLVVIVFNYARLSARRRGKLLFWLACGLASAGILITVGLYWMRLPHGLSGTYFANAAWQDDGTELDRFFDANGQRVDRFIDFQPNDFNNEYPFTWEAMSAHWQGFVSVPEDGYRLSIDTQNIGAWLRVDDVLVEGHHRIDFGSPSARRLLREGWSHDEVWGTGTSFPFVWGLEDRSEFYLGLDEAADSRLVFRCAPFQVPVGSPPQAITVFIADQLVGNITLKEGWHTYELSVPKRIIQESVPGFFRVKFAYARAASQSQDPRPLQVAFDFAWLQKLTDGAEASNAALSADSLPAGPSLSKGLHRIELKILTTEAKDVRIRLLWRSVDNSQLSVIPEDFLFPVTLESEKIQQRLPGERVWLGVSLFVNIISCLFSGVLMGWVVLATVDLRKMLRKEYLIVGAICGVALLLRILFIFEMKRIDPAFEILPRGTDHLTYVIYARGFLRGFWPGLFHQPFHGAPLIAFYLILCSILFGEKLLFARLATAVLATGTVWFAYKLARQTFHQSPVVAYVAAGLCACNGVLIFYDTSLLIAPLLTFCSVVSLYLMGKLYQQYSIKTGILLGAFLGLTALARSNILLIMPFFGLWMLLAFSGRFIKKVGYYVLVCLVMFLTLVPVTIRNYYSNERHEIVLTSGNGAAMLWLSNNPTANGAGGFSRKYYDEVHRRIRSKQTSYTREIIHYITDDPWGWVGLLYRKFVLFWRGYELANLLPYYVFRQASTLLKLPWINFVLIAPLGIVGMALVIKQWRATFMLYSYVFIQMTTTVIFHALARYRIPVVPVLTVFAAYTLWHIGKKIRMKQWRYVGLAVGAVIVLYLMINVPHAAKLYQRHHGEALPWLYVLRYWDLFHTW